MPSRTKLKIEIAELLVEQDKLHTEIAQLQGSLKQATLGIQRQEGAYRDMRVAFERLDKEYRALCDQWNAFQGCVDRPTSRDLERRRAQAEILNGLAQMLANALLPKDLR